MFVLIMIFASCHKEKGVIMDPPVQPPQVSMIGDREYFYGIPWNKDSSGYEMNLDAWRLTGAAINKGIKIYVAIYTDWSSFFPLPMTLSDPFLTDTINLTYTLVPGHVKVFAKTPADINWASDISIEYQ